MAEINEKGKHAVYTDKVAKPFGIFSQAIVFKGETEDFIFATGTPKDKDGKVVVGDIKAQTTQALENIKTLLEEVGATMDDVVKLHVNVANMDGLSEIHEVRAKYWKDKYPASSLVAVKSFVNKDFLIEIESTSIVSRKKN